MTCYSRANSANLHQLYVEPNDAKSKPPWKRPKDRAWATWQTFKWFYTNTSGNIPRPLWCLRWARRRSDVFCSCYSSFQERDATKHEKNKLCSGIFRSPIVPNNPKMYGCHKAHTNATPIGTFVGSCYTGARRQTSLSEVIAEFLFLSGRCLVGSCCNEQVTPHLGMLPQFGSFYSSLAPHLGWAQQLLPFSCQKKCLCDIPFTV